MPIFWAGDDESHALVLQAQIKAEELKTRDGMTAGYIENLIAQLPPIWHHEGNTAVINIEGPLVSGDAHIERLFGVIGYANIAQAVTEATMHADTERLMFRIETPGGDVNGLTEMGELLTQVSTIKPSAVYSGEMIASAGYWLGSAVKGPMTVGDTAFVGSIGVLRVHSERSKALAEMGIKTTILRSGKYKAEMNPVEELTEGAKARVEAQLADVHGLFRAQVARGRPQLSADELKEVTEGQTFLGKRAVQAGLADKVGSFTMALKLLDKQKHSRDTPSNSKGKAMLTAEQIQALLAQGVTLASIGLKDDGSPMSAEEIKARDDGIAAAEAETARLAAEAEAADKSKNEANAMAQVDTLKAKLTAVEAELTVAKADVINANVKLGQFDEMLTIVRKATAGLSIPLGGSAAAIDGMDAAAVVAEHARLSPLFLEKFKPGRQSQGPKASEAEAPALPQAFLRSTAAFNKTK